MKEVKGFTANTDIISQEEWNELDKEMKATFEYLSPYLKAWLFGCREAKNYLATTLKSDEGMDFDVIVRRHDSDPYIICPTCSDIKRIDYKTTNKTWISREDQRTLIKTIIDVVRVSEDVCEAIDGIKGLVGKEFEDC